MGVDMFWLRWLPWWGSVSRGSGVDHGAADIDFHKQEFLWMQFERDQLDSFSDGTALLCSSFVETWRDVMQTFTNIAVYSI